MILLLCYSSADAAEKVVVLKKANLIVGRLIEIAEHQSVIKEGAAKAGSAEVRLLIQTQNDLDVILRVAIASRANRFPGRAEDQIVDDVMDEAWTRCIGRIEQIGGSAAITTLAMLETRERLDGADSVEGRNALERLRNKK